MFGATWGLLQFVCGPILGLMADRWGRRPVLLISLFGLISLFALICFPSLTRLAKLPATNSLPAFFF